MRITRRPVDHHAICCALAARAVAIGTIDATRSGYITAHSSTCIPPIEPPTTLCQRRMPRWSASAAWLRTQSRTDTTGNRLPHGLPSSGCGLAGPVRALAAAEHVGAHHEPPVGVDRLAGADEGAPPPRRGVTGRERPGRVAVAGERVAHEDGVRRVVGERAPGLVGDGDVAEHPAALEREGAVAERQEPALRRPGRPRATRRWPGAATGGRAAGRRAARTRPPCPPVGAAATRPPAAGADTLGWVETRTLRCPVARTTSPPREAGEHLGCPSQVAGPGGPGHS